MTYIQVNCSGYRGADGTPRTPAGGLTAAALGLAAALERGRQQAAAKAAAAQPKAAATLAPAKASTPAFTGSRARAKALAWAVKNDPLCRGKAQAALALLADDDLNSATPAGLVKLLQRAPANMALPAPSAQHAQDRFGWGKIHAKLRQQRGQ